MPILTCKCGEEFEGSEFDLVPACGQCEPPQAAGLQFLNNAQYGAQYAAQQAHEYYNRIQQEEARTQQVAQARQLGAQYFGEGLGILLNNVLGGGYYGR